MRKTNVMFLALVLAGGCGSKKDGDKADPGTASGTSGASGKGGVKGDGKATGPAAPAGDPVATVGVEPGGIERDADEGAAAVITEMSGTVEVRRVGETEFAAAKADAELFSGDVVRTGDASTATITMADESVVEVAEVSSVGIATRDGDADPASAAAVLSGLARFTVIPRVPGEGAFKVYTPSGVVATKGTTYAVGVAADGEARIGVEAGSVEVVGLAALDAEPILVETGASATLEVAGTVAAPTPWPEDDWGVWRDTADAEVAVDAAFGVNADAMAALETNLTSAYVELEAGADEVAAFETEASLSAEANDTAKYEAALPEGELAIDASFGVAGAIEAYTWAYAGRATLASDLYVRHPDTLEVRWEATAPRVEAAVLWPKRFEITASAYLQPLRTQYYVHHHRGRMHAELVGVAVPEFYLSVNPPEIDHAKARAKVKVHVRRPTVVIVAPSARPVWVIAPAMNWRVKVKAKPAKYRAKATWYVRVPSPKAKVFVGVDIRGKIGSRLVVKAPEPRAKVRAHYKVKIGGKVKVRAPDLQVAARARAKVKIKGGVIVRDHRDDVKVKIKGGADDVSVKVKGGADVIIKGGTDAKVKVRDHRDDAEVKGGAGVDVKAKVKVKVKAPPPPKIKVKGGVKVGGKIKIGN